MDKYAGLAQSQAHNTYNAMAGQPQPPNPTMTTTTLLSLSDLSMKAGEIDAILGRLRERLLGPFPTNGSLNAKISEVPAGASAEIAQKISSLSAILNDIADSANTLERCI